MSSKGTVAGRNGVAVKRIQHSDNKAGYRTYEVHQRERVGESTEKIKPRQLLSEEYRRDPYPYLAILRDNYPFYRDWLSNSYWLTPYNDVTSVFVDEANFATRSRLWHLGLPGFGRDLGADVAVQTVETRLVDAAVAGVAERLVAAMRAAGQGDLARDFAGELPLALLCDSLAIPAAQQPQFKRLYWQMHRGVSWQPGLQQTGQQALQQMVDLLQPLVEQRRRSPGEDLLSAMLDSTDSADQGAVDAPDSQGDITARDIAVTLLERDHETLHGALANLWFLLLTHPDEMAKACSEQRLMKLAYLETLRHSTPVLSAYRFARHEVERFGKLIPAGARIICSAAAANRDPNIFTDPDVFIADRRDICHREPRGQYRADGLASGIAFGLGQPSRHPAVPEDRPRSRYALTRDTAVTASMQVVQMLPDLRLAPGAQPYLTALTVGEMHTCWQLPVMFTT